MRNLFFGWILLCPLMLFADCALGATLEQQRAAFLRAEQAVKQGQSINNEAIMAELADYPLLPSLLYQKFVRELGNTPQIEYFFARYPQTRQALLLRQRWLESLATQGAWADYIKHYRETENIPLQCQYYLALANLGRSQEAYAGAEKLWLTGSSLPESCERLFGLWQSSTGLTPELIWKRFALALQAGNRPLVDDLLRVLPPAMQPQGVLWRQVHENPRLALSCSLLSPAEPLSGLIFAHGMDRLANDDPVLAQTAWLLHKDRFHLKPEEAARLDRRTALALAGQRQAQARAYLLELPDENADAQTRAWRVRAALSLQDWGGALAAIERLQPVERKQAQWLYWKARALESLGDDVDAKENYRLAAQERDFFGFIAADRIGAGYAVSLNPSPVEAAALTRLAETPAFSIIRELLALHRDAESRSEWFHAIKPLNPSELLAAAQLARLWGLDNLAINTAAKAGNWDDLTLRFPLGSNRLVQQAAEAQAIDPAMIYALVRRESAFDPNAGSPVGAKGLMQLMPATADLVARHLNEPPPSPYGLLEPERNLRYGIAYFKELLEKFGHHFALTAAAYNAGPHRVEHWLPVNRKLPADLWVETIPFNETRQYVTAVLAYAVIYQLRLGLPPRRISEFLPDVPASPKGAIKPDNAISVPFCD